MKKRNSLLLFIFLITVSISNAQVVLEENFEGSMLPEGWTQQTQATDGGWLMGSSSQLSSSYWPIQDNGSNMIATNDDNCNCDKSEDYLILPPMDFSDLAAPIVEYSVFFGKQNYQGSLERAYVEVSIDEGISWTVVDELDGGNAWRTKAASLADYAGMSNVWVAFHYDDDGGWLYGIAIDDVVVKEQLALDAEMTSIDLNTFGETDIEYPIKGVISNKGSMTITSLELAYSVNGGTPLTATIDEIEIEPLETFDYSHPDEWVASDEGVYSIEVTIMGINESADLNADNNSAVHEIEIYEKVIVPNRIDEFVDGGAIITEIANSLDNLDKPTDLDFFPILGKYELWVINERIEDTGGTTVTFYNVGKEDQDALEREDGNAWHFMSLPTGIAFSETEFFGTSAGVQDANHSGGTFTGPTLWTSDPEIYARPSGGNGSHMDMLHGSPLSMGIAHEVDNVYWVFDGYNNHPVRYDFVEDHGPGADDHSDGIVRRYPEIEIERDGSVPSHLVIDKTTGWLYMADVGNDRVVRININSGTVLQALQEINEPLAEHSEMYQVEWEEIISSGLQQPCGIEVIGNRLLVGDYATGDIVIYDMENSFAELGRIETGSQGLTGLKVGPEGRIWFTNRLLNQLSVAEPGAMVNTTEISQQSTIHLTPNPTPGQVQILFDGPFEGNINLLATNGVVLESREVQSSKMDFNLEAYPAGIYFFQFVNNDEVFTKRIILE